MRHRDDLKPYQLTAVDFLCSHRFGALWLDMGLGKTAIALTALEDAFRGRTAERALIVAPLRVAVRTWPAEIAAWSHTKGLSYTVIRSSDDADEVAEAKGISRAVCRRYGFNARSTANIVDRAATRAAERVRERLLREPTQIHLVSRESVPWLVRKWGRNWPYDTLIYDESGGLRDHETERVRALIHIRKILRRMWQLTGTPAPESYLDVFPQVYLLDQGKRLGNNVTNFRAAHFVENRYAHKWTLKEGHQNEIIDAIDDIVLVMKAADYLPSNNTVYIDRPVTLAPEILDAYQELEETFVTELSDGHTLVADTAAALAQKLLQFASGSVYDENRGVHWVHDAKIEALQDIVNEAQGSPIVVVYHYRPTLARLKKAFPLGRQMDADFSFEADWNAGKVSMMFLHPDAGGEGLNLQHRCHYLVYFDIPYPLRSYLQTNGRIDRQGQTDVPRIYHLIAEGTVDEGIVPRLRRKENAQDYLFKRLQTLWRQRQENRHGPTDDDLADI